MDSMVHTVVLPEEAGADSARRVNFTRVVMLEMERAKRKRVE